MSNVAAIDRTLDALGDPMRRRIVERLGSGPVAVGELAETLPIGRPAVSRHLRVLTDAGLVEHTAQGTRNLYALAPEGQRELQQWLVALWDARLEAFAEFVASRPDEDSQATEPGVKQSSPKAERKTPADEPERKTADATKPAPKKRAPKRPAAKKPEAKKPSAKKQTSTKNTASDARKPRRKKSH